jgi:hypothetical protein
MGACSLSHATEKCVCTLLVYMEFVARDGMFEPHSQTVFHLSNSFVYRCINFLMVNIPQIIG